MKKKAGCEWGITVKTKYSTHSSSPFVPSMGITTTCSGKCEIRFGFNDTQSSGRIIEDYIELKKGE